MNELCYLVFNRVECCFFQCFFCCFFWCETRLHVATEPRDEARLNGDDAEDGGEGLERPGGGAQAPVPAGVEVREHRIRLCQRAEHDEDVEQLVTVEEVVAPTGQPALRQFADVRGGGGAKPHDVAPVEAGGGTAGEQARC